MTMAKEEAAYLAASRVTTQRVLEVGAVYLTWIATKATEATAIRALLAASGSFKNPTRVTARADVYYASLEHDPPTVASIAPNTGTTAGGTAVVITGTNLTGATGVTFGGTAGTALVVVSDTVIHITTPAKTAGAKDVVVTTPDGVSTSVGGFTYA